MSKRGNKQKKNNKIADLGPNTIYQYKIYQLKYRYYTLDRFLMNYGSAAAENN